MALKKYGFGVREGLYTNMNAIRKDEEVDNLHSSMLINGIGNVSSKKKIAILQH